MKKFDMVENTGHYTLLQQSFTKMDWQKTCRFYQANENCKRLTNSKCVRDDCKSYKERKIHIRFFLFICKGCDNPIIAQSTSVTGREDIINNMPPCRDCGDEYRLKEERPIRKLAQLYDFLYRLSKSGVQITTILSIAEIYFVTSMGLKANSFNSK